MHKALSKHLLLLLLVFSPVTHAVETLNADFYNTLIKNMASDKVPNNDSGEFSIKALELNVPLGSTTAPVPPECHPLEFQTQALSNYQSADQYAKFTKDYISKCSQFLTRGNVLGLAGLLKLITIQYDLSKNKNLTKVTLTLSDGSKLDSLIGVKDLNTKRPWVIMKCGVFCDIDSSATGKSFIINFFDQSPFNIIFLSNYTGIDHIKENHSLRLGGFYEAYDLYDVARWLKYESPYKNTVDSIHAAGISLGSSAALAVSNLKSFFISSNGEPLFNSTSAICPVVNLKPTLNDMYANSTKGKIFTPLTWKYLKEAESSLPEAKDYLSSKTPPSAEKFPSMLSDIVLRYGKMWELASPPGRHAPIPVDIDDYLSKNEFSINQESIDIPTLAWASFDDNVVNYELNTKTLVDAVNLPSTVGAIGVPEGDHCGFDSAYGFLTTTSILQTFILNNSPSFKLNSQLARLALPDLGLKFSTKETHLRQTWKVEAGSNIVQLKYEVFNPTLGLSCRWAKPFQSPSNCRKEYTQSIPVEFFKNLFSVTPQNNTEAQILTRKLNSQLRVTNNKTPIDGTKNTPEYITWRTFEN